MDINYRWGMWEGGGEQDGVEWRGGNGITVIAQSINIFFKKNRFQDGLDVDISKQGL